jgi:radical SAM protein with 4Fe4S-binding SPASM domain
MDFTVKTERGHFLVSSCSTGAVSLFTPAEYLAFQSIIHVADEERKDVLRKVMVGFGCNEETINHFTDIFLRKLSMQGWFRNSLNDPDPDCAQVVYLTITKHCNLSCIYCYIGDDRRRPEYIMPVRDARTILRKVREINPSSRIVVTGGEPFTHPGIFEILDTIEEMEMKFTLGTNAILVDENCARKLKSYRYLTFIQVSMDGMTPETHSITRGNSWHKVMEGLQCLIKEKIPFSVAPTLHEGNLHEIPDIVRFAYGNGGFFSPNHLRKFPHAPYSETIVLKPESLRKCILDTLGIINDEFKRKAQPEELQDKRCEELRDMRCRYVCGNARYTIDVDWNGDVYPCHLLREKEFILGNILIESLDEILDRGRKSPTRLKAYEIPKCSKCPFVSMCAGGCRASGYYLKGTFAAEDEFCEILYLFEIDKLFLSKGIFN